MTAEPSLAATTGHRPPAPADFRHAMAEFATGVTVITGMDGEEPVGFACQSFASVSLEPPLVLFCADHRGRSWPRMRDSGRFCVNVLGEDQQDLCARFGSSRGLRYEGLDWELSPWDTPSLPGVLVRVHAAVHAVHTAGDHDVVLGRVLSLEHVSQGRPMVFFRSRFGLDEPAPPLTPELWFGSGQWG
ncbi:flavin reductase family protein [Actinocorallia sp. B10E7]|uniref:flavin reductase family protein n=1 Tax=Actinocorallia sp. B10E7 TaxID=3153558 RepID=UPI00325EC1F8